MNLHDSNIRYSVIDDSLTKDSMTHDSVFGESTVYQYNRNSEIYEYDYHYDYSTDSIIQESINHEVIIQTSFAENRTDYPCTEGFVTDESDTNISDENNSYIGQDTASTWDGFSDYDDLYLKSLMKSETRLGIYNANAPFVRIRTEFIFWMNDSCASIGFYPNIARNAVTLLDYVLTSQTNIDSSVWIPVGIACIVLTCKYLQVKSIRSSNIISKLITICQNSHTSEQVRQAEVLVLQVTNWNIHTITPFHFISLHQQRYPDEYTDPKYLEVIGYLIDSITMDYGCRLFKPSILAESGIYAARKILQLPPIPFILSPYTHHDIVEIAKVMISSASTASFINKI